jgi:DNA mismatch repair protein MLH1
LFYQLGLRQFGAYGRQILDPPLSVRELLEIALDGEDEVQAKGLTVEQVLEVSLLWYTRSVQQYS